MVSPGAVPPSDATGFQKQNMFYSFFWSGRVGRVGILLGISGSDRVG